MQSLETVAPASDTIPRGPHRSWSRALVAALLLVVPSLARAQAAPPAPPSTPAPATAPAEEEVNLDDVKPPPPPAALPGGQKALISVGGEQLGVKLLGRFDLNYELSNPTDKYPDRQSRFVSYHHFVFIQANAGPVSFFGELTQLLFYEGTVKLDRDFSVSFGKILVPFGRPGFHRFYGGVQGDPLVGIFLPVVWSEYGVRGEWKGWRSGLFSVGAEAYVVRAFGAAADGTPLTQTSPAAGDDKFAGGGRINLSYSKVSAWFSGYATRYTSGGALWLGAFDAATEYGLVPLPILKDLRIAGGVAAMTWDQPGHARLYRYGDYLELEYRTPITLKVRGRVGTYVHDSKVHPVLDKHNWNAALVMPLPWGLSAFAEYQWNMEEANEVKNDVLRVGMVIEF